MKNKMMELQALTTIVKIPEALSSKILHIDLSGSTNDMPWEYRRILGFPQKPTGPDIAYASMCQVLSKPKVLTQAHC